MAKLPNPISKTDADKNLSDEQTQRLGAIAKALIPETTSSDAGLRAEAVATLSEVQSPGVCVALLSVAANDADAKIKSTARNGISATALPDAVGSLLKAMTSNSSTDLKIEAAAAFAKVRDKARSEELLPLLTSPDESVRREIVAALGKRNADSKASEGVTQALKDASPAIRKLAARALQMTGISGSANQLIPLVLDPDPAVRIQCAETFGELRDDASKKALLDSFASNPDADTMKALSKSLGKRSSRKGISGDCRSSWSRQKNSSRGV